MSLVGLDPANVSAQGARPRFMRVRALNLWITFSLQTEKVVLGFPLWGGTPPRRVTPKGEP